MALINKRNHPFAWQDKTVLRAIRKKYQGLELVKMKLLYCTLTEIESDFNENHIKYFTKTIHTYSGLPKDWIPKGLKRLEDMGIFTIEQEREHGKFKAKYLVWNEKYTQNTVTGKTVNGKTINGNPDTSDERSLLDEHSLSDEINPPTPSPKGSGVSPPKKPYGEAKTIFLTDEEYQKLKKEFTRDFFDVDEEIENIADWKVNNPTLWPKSHYRGVRKWLRKALKAAIEREVEKERREKTRWAKNRDIEYEKVPPFSLDELMKGV